MKYDFKKTEEKWQKIWEENDTFRAEDGSDKKKFYALVEFPYPSGAGMLPPHPATGIIIATQRSMAKIFLIIIIITSV